MNEQENIKVHDEVMKDWTKTGEILHIWRDYEDGYLVSYYVTLFRNDGRASMDFARIFGQNPRAPSIDQRITTGTKVLEELYYQHKHVTMESE